MQKLFFVPFCKRREPFNLYVFFAFIPFAFVGNNIKVQEPEDITLCFKFWSELTSRAWGFAIAYKFVTAWLVHQFPSIAYFLAFILQIIFFCQFIDVCYAICATLLVNTDDFIGEMVEDLGAIGFRFCSLLRFDCS